MCLEHLHLSSDASDSENPSELLEEGWGRGTVKIHSSAYRPKYGAEKTPEQLRAALLASATAPFEPREIVEHI